MFNSTKVILFVVACGSTIACAQTNSGATRKPPAVSSTDRAQGTVPAHSSTGSLGGQKSVPISLEYWLFIAEKARDHESIQKALQENPNRFPSDIELRDMSMHIGIRPEEYATILTHILDANDRLKENEREWKVALSNFQNSAAYSAKSIAPPELLALGKKHDDIINGTVRSLKHDLGKGSFHKLNVWVDLNFRSQSSEPALGTEPSQTRPSAYPSTWQAPVLEV